MAGTMAQAHLVDSARCCAHIHVGLSIQHSCRACWEGQAGEDVPTQGGANSEAGAVGGCQAHSMRPQRASLFTVCA